MIYVYVCASCYNDKFLKVQNLYGAKVIKCDMIKGNESDVRNIHFELQA